MKNAAPKALDAPLLAMMLRCVPEANRLVIIDDQLRIGVTGDCPTLLIASNKSEGRPHREFMKISVTLTAIATIAHTGYTKPVAAAGIPMPLKRKAIATFCCVFR